MKKIVVLMGSPRHKHTWHAVEEILGTLKAEGDYEFQIFEVKDLEVPTCVGCFTCFTKGESFCPHFESMQRLEEALNAADGIIVGSPVYSMGIPGGLKNVFDHLAYRIHRPAYFDAKALVVITTAGSNARSSANFISDTLRHWGVNRVVKVTGNVRDTVLKPRELFDNRLHKAAKKFHDELECGRVHRPSIKIGVGYSVAQALLTNSKTSEADRSYWQKESMVNSVYGGREEFPIHPVNRLIRGIIKRRMKKN